MIYKQILGIITLILVVIGYIPYIKDVLVGKTKPHAFSWLVWGVLTAIGFFIQITNQAGPGAWFNGLMVLVCAFIMVMGFIKGKKEIIFIDFIVLALASIATYLWLIVKEPILSMILVITADFLGTVPTIRKSYVHPYTETLITWAISVIRITIGIFALERLSFLTASYHFYMVIVNTTIVMILVLRRRYLSVKG